MQPKSRSPILIVDDHPVIRQLFAVAFEDEGFEVLQAADGEEAVRVLQRRQPSAIVLDYAMPLMNGLAVARWIRSNPAHRSTRVIACCGMPEALKDSHDLFDAVVSKPIVPSDLVAVVVGLLESAGQSVGESAS